MDATCAPFRLHLIRVLVHLCAVERIRPVYIDAMSLQLQTPARYHAGSGRMIMFSATSFHSSRLHYPLRLIRALFSCISLSLSLSAISISPTKSTTPKRTRFLTSVEDLLRLVVENRCYFRFCSLVRPRFFTFERIFNFFLSFLFRCSLKRSTYWSAQENSEERSQNSQSAVD